jgi:hypothetical protein
MIFFIVPISAYKIKQFLSYLHRFLWIKIYLVVWEMGIDGRGWAKIQFFLK